MCEGRGQVAGNRKATDAWWWVLWGRWWGRESDIAPLAEVVLALHSSLSLRWSPSPARRGTLRARGHARRPLECQAIFLNSYDSLLRHVRVNAGTETYTSRSQQWRRYGVLPGVAKSTKYQTRPILNFGMFSAYIGGGLLVRFCILHNLKCSSPNR